MILDQFKTLQTDFDSLSKKCDLKVAENEDLKKLLQESENKSSIMELERDLLKANEQKLREDLDTVVSKMFDISLYESSELNKEDNIVDNITSIDSKQCEKLSERVEGQNFVSHNERLPIEVRKKIPFRNQKLASTLSRISNGGVNEFYRGYIANELIDDLKLISNGKNEIKSMDTTANH